MASTISGSEAPVHFALLSDDVLPNKRSENKLITTTAEPSKTNEVGEDDVFASENETARAALDSNFQKESERALDNTVVESQVSISTVSPESGLNNSIAVTTTSNNVIPVSTTATTRRPSYTSKAPSALTNLPKIDDLNTSPTNIQNFATLHTTSLHLEKRSSTSGFDHEDHHHHHIRSAANKDLLSLHGQASFDSIDEYSNPGTPTSNLSPAAGGQTSSGKYREKSRLRTDVLSKGKWEMAARSPVLTVRCRDQVAELHKYKFGSGSKGKCIKVIYYYRIVFFNVYIFEKTLKMKIYICDVPGENKYTDFLIYQDLVVNPW